MRTQTIPDTLPEIDQALRDEYGWHAELAAQLNASADRIEALTEAKATLEGWSWLEVGRHHQ